MSSEQKEVPDFKQGVPEREIVVMPQAPTMEKSLISMMVVDPTNIISHCISEGMTEDFFYVPAHRILWNIFRERYESNKPVDMPSVAQELEDSKQLVSVGGHAGLVEIFSFATSTALFHHHFDIVREKYLRRSLIMAANEITAYGHSDATEIVTALDNAEQAVMRVRQSSVGANTWSLKADLMQALTNMERLISEDVDMLGIPTGYPLLDRKINGLKGGDLFVIAARPSMGKTSFLLNIVEHLALEVKKPVLVFSCEMPSVQLVERLLYARSGVSRQKFARQKSQISRESMKRFNIAFKEYNNSKLVIDDTAAISISELRAKARRVRKEHPDLCAIGIDYLQLMRSHTKQAQNSREREIAEISGGLKSLAKELNLPIIVLAQLNRSAETRTGKSKGVPMMSDLRESGAIEQDADMIGLLYRSAYYSEDDEERAEKGDEAKLILAKNRNGPTGDIPLYFRAELMRFEPREETEGEEA